MSSVTTEYVSSRRISNGIAPIVRSQVAREPAVVAGLLLVEVNRDELDRKR